jgi:hypothetical protein
MVNISIWKSGDHGIPCDPDGDLGRNVENMGAWTIERQNPQQFREEGLVSIR